jgi:hypothetical protein
VLVLSRPILNRVCHCHFLAIILINQSLAIHPVSSLSAPCDIRRCMLQSKESVGGCVRLKNSGLLRTEMSQGGMGTYIWLKRSKSC